MTNPIALLIFGLLVVFLYGYLKRDVDKRHLKDRVQYLEKWEKRYKEDAERWKNSYDELQTNASFIRMDNHHL